jgi:hypothetical protein
VAGLPLSENSFWGRDEEVNDDDTELAQGTVRAQTMETGPGWGGIGTHSS